MSELNERTTLNYKLRQATQETKRQAHEAMGRKLVRAINRAYRKAVTTVAIDAALVGAGLSGVIAAVACLICWVL